MTRLRIIFINNFFCFFCFIVQQPRSTWQNCRRDWTPLNAPCILWWNKWKLSQSVWPRRSPMTLPWVVTNPWLKLQRGLSTWKRAMFENTTIQSYCTCTSSARSALKNTETCANCSGISVKEHMVARVREWEGGGGGAVMKRNDFYGGSCGSA